MAVPEMQLTLTQQEYLDFEEKSQVKHEFVRGRIFAMAGASDAHNQVTGNVFALLHARLKGTGCFAYVADMKVRVELADSFYYPDVMVTCEAFAAKSVYKTQPVLIVEVLSPSTADIDRREKLVAYGLLPNLKEYLIVHQDKRLVELYQRSASGESWTAKALAASAPLSLSSLPSGDFSFSLDEIYSGIVPTE